jgi:hypothetical protein
MVNDDDLRERLSSLEARQAELEQVVKRDTWQETWSRLPPEHRAWMVKAQSYPFGSPEYEECLAQARRIFTSVQASLGG